MSRSRRKQQPWLHREMGGVPNWVTLAAACLMGALVLFVLWDQSRPEPAPRWNPAAQSNEPEPSVSPSPDPVVTVERPEDDPLAVLFLGDSLTGNLHASTEDAGFRPQMIRAMEEGGPVTEVERFIEGGTASEVAGDGVVFDPTPDLAVIQLGTNDYNRTPIPEFTTFYRGLLADTISAAPDVEILCVGTWQPGEYGNPFDRVIQSECEEAGGVYRDLTDMHEDQENRGPAGREDVFGGPSDNFHPNDTGYMRIAERLLGAVVID